MAAGDPTGADLTSGTTDGDTLPQVGSWEERQITFVSGIALTSGTKYAIVVRAASATPGDDIHWIAVTPSGIANGNNLISANSGSTWSAAAAWDSWFKTKALGVEKDTHTPASEASFDAFSAADWAAQTFTASSSYTITSVILKMQRFSLVLPGTVTVGIRATEVALPSKATTPAPADDAVTIRKNQITVGWVDGGGADDFDVYFGKQGSATLRSAGQAGVSWAITDTLFYNTVYEWRIDSNNAGGTTTGDTWLFTILVYDPPLPTGITLTGNSGPSGEGTRTGTATGENSMLTIRRLIAVAESKFWYENI